MASEPAPAQLSQIEALNRSFYSVEPHDYLGRRLRLLMISAAKPRSVARIVNNGLRYGKITLGPPPEGRRRLTKTERLEDEKLHRQFVTAEAANVLHHAAETLLRLYVAHRSLPACPWLELATERSFSRFKKTVRELVDIGAEQEELAAVFYGPSKRPKGGPATKDWNASLDNITSWLRYYGRLFLDDANLYNASKHGLAVQPGNAEFHMAESGSNQAFLSTVGPAISFLEVDKDGDIAQATRWLNLDQMLFATNFATQMIQNLWAVARLRYLNEPIPEKTCAFFLHPNFRDVMLEALSNAGGVTSLSMKVLGRQRGPKSK